MAAKQHAYRRALSGLLLSAVVLVSIDATAWERDQKVIKLSPHVRALPHREAIEPIALEEARAFLREHRVVDDTEVLQELAYVVAGDDRRLISGAGDRLYVRGVVPHHGQVGIYRQSEPYLAMDGTPLGLELINVASLATSAVKAILRSLKSLVPIRKCGLTILCCPWRSAS